eukprot:CAMPEP_0119551252 /NCGR_PEP_ID=MMETSP1352-20130426/4548_1 /TAXON_ID=265584 /ORGANISM="Stauroneis constricta, Strain CCMP1120" /LENGTH=1377 /DNA_ID=CAMNT_0007597273 /DNA_START=1 /DNA_END=4130 /DNA_ORIENTATION=-
MFARNGNGGRKGGWNHRRDGKLEFASPLDELIKRMDRLDDLVRCNKWDFIQSMTEPCSTPTRKSARSSIVDSLKKLRNRGISRDTNGTNANAPNDETDLPQSHQQPSASRASLRRVDAAPKILPMSVEHTNEMIECLRRIAELVIVGERVVAKDVDIRDKIRSRHNDGDPMDPEEEAELRSSRSPDSDQYMSIFDEFFERRGLELIVNIATGRCFEGHDDAPDRSSVDADTPSQNDDSHSQNGNGPNDAGDDGAKSNGDPDNNLAVNTSTNSQDSINTSAVVEAAAAEQLMKYFLLPPTAVATQAIQSVSLLVQNVSRATSLYFILSNNHVNEMIEMPLQKYKDADWKTRAVEETLDQRKHASPEIAELTTHFVTFLKSLALRMNAETLQFFLTYPMEQVHELDDDETGTQTASSSNFSRRQASDSTIPSSGGDDANTNPRGMDNKDDDIDDDRPLDEITEDRGRSQQPPLVDTSKPVVLKEVEVCFPLYGRALEFCASHQDNFIRVTAMNICLNTLRLATVQPAAEAAAACGGNSAEIDFETSSSPDGVLHNAKALPFRVRLAIAQHVCSPARVERLVSPIFAKLAQVWGILEEKFRETGEKDANSLSRATAKIALAKEISRRKRTVSAFKDIAYKLQDELELLEDVLKVGLTSLNEQVIEMMLATFVYPLLLQPLLLYFQRAKAPDNVLFADPLHDHTTGRRIKPVDYADAEKSFISAPAKSALFMLTSVFCSVTNRPLLNLLFCALFHPFSPDASGETMIRTKADVACVDARGKKSIRVDPIVPNTIGSSGRPSSLKQPTYLFGTATGQKVYSSTRSAKAKTKTETGDNVCTFVLAPALAEVLGSSGDDLAIIARSRQNPYRRAIFRCCTLSHELSDLKPLSILAIDAAVSALDEAFVVDMLQGLKFRDKLNDSTPLDERRSDSSWARTMDDRGIGGPAARESRQSFGSQQGGGSKLSYNFLNEILTSFRSSLIYATPGCNGNWKLVFDPVAAHALLRATRGNAQVLSVASKGSAVRSRQAAGFLSDLPQAIEKFLGSAWVFSKDPEMRSGMITDVLFYAKSVSDGGAVAENLVPIKDPTSIDGDLMQCVVPVSSPGDFDELCTRACSFPPAEYSTNDVSIEEAMASADAWIRVDAFCNFIRTLADNRRLQSGDRTLGGFALLLDGTTKEFGDSKSLFGVVTPRVQQLLMNPILPGQMKPIDSGMIISFIGKTAIPCVCEAPASAAYLFSADSARTISEGVTWQSLYLVLSDGHFILAEPHRGTNSDGRVAMACPLQNMKVKRDESEAAESTVARRLLVNHYSYTQRNPPGLFLTAAESSKNDGNETNSNTTGGNGRKNVATKSTLDIWFENQNAAEQAFSIINDSVVRAKAHR